MYDPRDIPPLPNFHDELKGKPPIYRRYRDAFIGEKGRPRSWEECAQWAALYYGFTTQIDDQIGRVLSALKELALDKDTAVLFSTDHGDLTGAHGGMHDKDGVLCQEVYHIPLTGRVPGGTAGTVCHAPVSNMDLSRTILELAGCEYPEDLDGKSLVPALMDESFDSAAQWPDYVVSEFFGAHFAYEARLIIHGYYKYVFHPGAFDELYNLKKDPWEMQNLIDSDNGEDKRMLRECRYRLIEWAKKTGDELVILCGLFHRRLEGELAPYTPKSMDALRKSETKLL
jgi:arylsulfatase A-like enzyme